MSEKYEAPPNKREFDRQLAELTLNQLNDTIRLAGQEILSDEISSDEDLSLKLSEWTKENYTRLPEILGRAKKESSPNEEKYTPEQLAESSMAFLKLCLLTPRFVRAQDKNNRRFHASPELKQELGEFNKAIKEAVRSNPTTSYSSIIASLQRTALWAGIAASESFPRLMLEGTLNGVRGELAMEDILSSQACQEAGIVLTATSPEEDLRAIDAKASVPIQFEDSAVTIDLNIDVKSNLNDIIRYQHPHERGQTFMLRRDRVIMWPGITSDEMGDQMLLDQATAEELGEATVPILHTIAERYHRRALRLGQTGLHNT